MVIWIIGLSGSGKTTLGKQIYELLKSEKSNTVLVDGDEIRAIFKYDRGEEPYTLEGRRKNADRICKLCTWLDSQQINVVCCILSLFEQSRQWNREHYSKYYEVYIDVPMNILRKRDIKNLYESALQGKIKNVVGVDIPFSPPEHSDYNFDNSVENKDLKDVAIEILREAKKG